MGFWSYEVGIAIGALGTLAAVLLLALGFKVSGDERDLLREQIIEIPGPAEAQPFTIPEPGEYVVFVAQNSSPDEIPPDVTPAVVDEEGGTIALSEPPQDVVRLSRWWQTVWPMATFAAEPGTYRLTAVSASGKQGINDVHVGPLMKRRWPSGLYLELPVLAISWLTSLVILVRVTTRRFKKRSVTA